MKKIGQFTESELKAHNKADSLLTDVERQAAYKKVWDSVGKRIKLPENSNFIVRLNGEIVSVPKKKNRFE